MINISIGHTLILESIQRPSFMQAIVRTRDDMQTLERLTVAVCYFCSQLWEQAVPEGGCGAISEAATDITRTKQPRQHREDQASREEGRHSEQS